MAEKERKPVLTGRNAAYAVGAGAVVDILAALFLPEYSGVFSGVARMLIGG